jgi:AcrR family transcriptional regulator
MTEELVHTPKQTRSQNTQERVLRALEEMLSERFFEQITIRDLAARTGVASGTIYRRFKDKEALLPVLYERFDHTMSDWATGFWDDFDLDTERRLEPRIRHLVGKHVVFYKAHAPILRTVYLYMRLHGELSVENIDQKRQSVYQRMLEPVLAAFASEEWVEPNIDQVKLFLLLLLSSVNERMLFGDLKPARTLQMDDEAFVTELTAALQAYLSKGPTERNGSATN